MEGSPDSMASLGLSQTFFGQKLGGIRRVFCPPLSPIPYLMGFWLVARQVAL